MYDRRVDGYCKGDPIIFCLKSARINTNLSFQSIAAHVAT